MVLWSACSKPPRSVLREKLLVGPRDRPGNGRLDTALCRKPPRVRCGRLHAQNLQPPWDHRRAAGNTKRFRARFEGELSPQSTTLERIPRPDCEYGQKLVPKECRALYGLAHCDRYCRRILRCLPLAATHRISTPLPGKFAFFGLAACGFAIMAVRSIAPSSVYLDRLGQAHFPVPKFQYSAVPIASALR